MEIWGDSRKGFYLEGTVWYDESDNKTFLRFNFLSSIFYGRSPAVFNVSKII